MSERSTVRSTYGNRQSSVPLQLVIVGVVLAAIAAMIAFSWWYYSFSVNKDAQIRRDSFNFQTTAQEQVVKLETDIAAIDVQVAGANADQQVLLSAQRKAIVNQLCEIGGRINDPEPAVKRIMTKEGCV